MIDARRCAPLCLALCLSFSGARAAPDPSPAQPANDLIQLRTYLSRCFAPESRDLDADLTLRFSLRRDGRLIASPHISYDRLPPDAETRRQKLELVEKAFARCLPAPMTDALGGAVAGRMMSFRFVRNTPPAR